MKNRFFDLLFDKALKFIYPDKCIVCHKIYNNNQIGICPSCIENFVLFDREVCWKNFEKNNGFSMFLYNSAMKNVIHSFKYKDYGYYARVMGIKMAEFFIEKNFCSPDFIVPVPIHHNRKRQRGFNQIDIIVKQMSKISCIPVLYNAVIRKKDTKPQFNLDKEMRIKNIQGAFQVLKPELFINKNVLIIDDIYTTGSTINELSAVIKNTGVNEIFYFTLSSTRIFV